MKTNQLKSSQEQAEILLEHFPDLDLSNAPQGIGYIVPKWSLIATTYTEALEKMLHAIASTRKFHNYRSSEMRKFKETKRKVELMQQLPEIMSLDAQLGEKYKAKSVEVVRNSLNPGELGLGAYEVACILLTHPALLTDYDDLWIDCPGDEFTGESEFSSAPYFIFRGGRLGFGRRWIGLADGGCGSASAVLPQSNLESRSLESIVDLALENRVKALEEWRERVQMP